VSKYLGAFAAASASLLLSSGGLAGRRVGARVKLAGVWEEVKADLCQASMWDLKEVDGISDQDLSQACRRPGQMQSCPAGGSFRGSYSWMGHMWISRRLARVGSTVNRVPDSWD